ncbi:MAG: hypothetical protein KAW52_02840 [candidate division Zixibacteria bacterium]|nr:hypothetical protein [candidate division Zixibacteria bacterium]
MNRIFGELSLGWQSRVGVELVSTQIHCRKFGKRLKNDTELFAGGKMKCGLKSEIG